MALDDEDISQVLSLPLKDFEAGLSLLPELRQRISTPRMLTLHIPEQTDAFTLYVKGTILFSKVKNFNIRFKSKYYYAVASSSTHGDRFGTFGTQTTVQTQPPPIQRPVQSTVYPGYQTQSFTFPHSPSSSLYANGTNALVDHPMVDDKPSSAGDVSASSTHSIGPLTKQIRGPSPDMAPLASLGTSGVLQDAQSPTNGTTSTATGTAGTATATATATTTIKSSSTDGTVPPIVNGITNGTSPVGPANPLSSTAQLLEGTRWHQHSAPYELFSPATTGNPLPGPLGAYASPPGQGPERIDPRDTPSFRAVDGLIEGFRTSFPRHLRDPVEGGRVDSELYVACLVPHV
ncbi:hypothetical protein FRC17_005896 [Serendipita sp. 399]|nr:hypothetical protein FRC17_005896 [Serendipita sp. 399]